MKKKIIIIIGILIVVALICGNFYAFGWKKIEQRIFINGVNAVIAHIIQQVETNGQVVIDTPNEQIILIPKINQPQQIIPVEEE